MDVANRRVFVNSERHEAGAARAFEAALREEQPKLQGETLWYRMVAGGSARIARGFTVIGKNCQ